MKNHILITFIVTAALSFILHRSFFVSETDNRFKFLSATEKLSQKNPEVARPFAELFQSDASSEDVLIGMDALLEGANGILRDALGWLNNDGSQKAFEQRKVLLEMWASKNPLELIDYLESEGIPGRDKDVFKLAFEELANADPKNAIAVAKNLSQKSAKGPALRAIVDHIAKDSPMKAWALCESSMTDTGEMISFKEQMEFTILAHISAEDLLRDSSFLGNRPSFFTLSTVVAKLGTYDLPTALSWLNESAYPRGLTAGVRSSAVLAAASNEQIGAQEAFDLLSETGGNRLAFDQLGKTLAKKDLSKFLEWALSMDSSINSTSVLKSGLEIVANSDLDLALDIADQIPGRQVRENLVSDYVAKRALADPKTTMDWISNYETDQRSQESLFRVAAKEWAKNKPEEALSYIQSETDNGIRNAKLQGVVLGIGESMEGKLEEDWATELGWVDNIAVESKSELASAVFDQIESNRVGGLGIPISSLRVFAEAEIDNLQIDEIIGIVRKLKNTVNTSE